MSASLQRFALPCAASQCSNSASALAQELNYNNISAYWRRGACRNLATCSEDSEDQPGVPIAVVPGTTFNIEAGRNHVLINHVQGWRDTATLQVRACGARGVLRSLSASRAAQQRAARQRSASHASPGTQAATARIIIVLAGKHVA